MKKSSLVIFILLTGSSICLALNRADLLPEEDAVQFHISNVQAVKSALMKTPIGRLCQDEQFAAFLNLQTTNLFQVSETDSPSLKQLKLITGEMAVSGSVPDGTMFFAVELSPEEYTKYCELQDKIIADEAMIRKNHTFQDIPLVEEVNPEGKSIWRVYYQRTVLEGTSREQIEKAVMRLKAGTLNAADSEPPVFKMILPSPGNLLREIIDAVKNKNQNKPQIVDFDALFKAAGLSSISRLETALTFNGTETLFRMDIQGGNLNQGLFALTKTAPVRLPPAAFIPKDLFYFKISQPDISAIWFELQKIITAASPLYGASVAQLPAMVQQLCAIDFQQELLNTFGSTLLSYTAPGADAPRTGIALELKDGVTLKNSLDKLLTAPALAAQTAAIKQEPFRDTTLYEIATAQSGDTIAFAALPAYFLYGTGEDVRALIRSIQVPAEGAGYLDSALIRELTARAPRSACALSAINGKEYAAILIAELQKPQYRSRIEQSNWNPDFTKLPSSQHVGGFFNNAFGWTEASPDKWTFTFLMQN
ncbi:MAG: hypothetical protein MUC65_08550 [Pontiellaceae bacterium]|jgi:hypothetical protein|nr:hypothetical protein [Pontiellaceae bacterium]